MSGCISILQSTFSKKINYKKTTSSLKGNWWQHGSRYDTSDFNEGTPFRGVSGVGCPFYCGFTSPSPPTRNGLLFRCSQLVAQLSLTPVFIRGFGVSCHGLALDWLWASGLPKLPLSYCLVCIDRYRLRASRGTLTHFQYYHVLLFLSTNCWKIINDFCGVKTNG